MSGKVIPIELKYDTPLSTPDDDILGRKRFAENLAKSIIGLEASQGFVYGLYGPWGSGKSTVINFIEYYIKEHNEKTGAEPKIAIFRFNPWMFSGTENLTKFYLDQLRARLSMDDVSEELQKVSKGLDLLESALSLTAPFANAIIPASGNVLNALKKGLTSTKEIAKSASEALKKDIHQIKMEITAALQNQQDKILVVIDDLDRLFDDEIKDFIKMIKAVCDFPKIIYLIACDSDKIANALNRDRDDNVDGYNYLEKIVQCSFNIPRPDKSGLHQLFSMELDQILEPLKNQELLFSANDWGNIFHDGVAPRLKTPRNVKTLINSIAACYPAVRDEVNVADFVGVQVLRVFYPKAYALIDQNKECMLGSTIYEYGGDNRRKVWESFYEQLHKEVPEKDLNDFKALMGRMFPKYAQIVSNGMGYGSDFFAKWKQQRKVRSEACFDLYFTLSIPEDSFSLEEMQTIIALADKPDILKERLRLFIESDKSTKKGRYQSFLGELEDFTGETIPVDKISPLLQAIYDLSDEVGPDFDYRSFLGINISSAMMRISLQLTKRFVNKEDRFHLLKKIYENSISISMVVDGASTIEAIGSKENENIVAPEHAEELIAIALKRIKEFADNGKLPKVSQFAHIMYRWRNWASEDEVRLYVAGLVEADEGLIDFLTGFLSMSMSHSGDDRVTRKNYYVSHKTVLDFVSSLELEKLVERAQKILTGNEQLQERQKKAIEVFVDEKNNPQDYRY